MVQLMVKLGPKGQVLIPKLLRDEYRLYPGKEVLIKETAEGVLISGQVVDPIAIFEKCAKLVGRKKTYTSKEYEEYLERS